MQALAVICESHQGPLALDLLEAAQREPGEAEHRLDDAEDRLDGLVVARNSKPLTSSVAVVCQYR